MLLVQKQFLQNVFFIKFRTIYTFSVYGKKKNKTSVEGEWELCCKYR